MLCTWNILFPEKVTLLFFHSELYKLDKLFTSNLIERHVLFIFCFMLIFIDSDYLIYRETYLIEKLKQLVWFTGVLHELLLMIFFVLIQNELIAYYERLLLIVYYFERFAN